MLTPLKRIGGKAAIARWIIRCLPAHRNYVEVFGGSAAVLFAKTRPAGVEVYNDLDGRLLTDRRISSLLDRADIRHPRFHPHA